MKGATPLKLNQGTKVGIKKNKNIKMKFLKTLNIAATNKGVSTGVNWVSAKGEKIISYSPVDGNVIGSVLVPIEKLMIL